MNNNANKLKKWFEYDFMVHYKGERHTLDI